ncbi:MAG: type II CRISPR-associated endonuclease Cas1 [Lachnospiraceae bacterium]|nr:type II CRISPR-associated endonuclease Cas1 [Lachnospiraceae bacterium]
MPFRTLEITKPSEIHINFGQLEITQEEKIFVPIEDLYQITALGPNIRLSTMDLSILSQNNVSIMTLDEKYLPTAIVLPFSGNSRQSQIMHAQVSYSEEKYKTLWEQIIKRKVENQSRNLTLLGLDGAEKIATYSQGISADNVDYIEAISAKEYFQKYHCGLNRRGDDPVNNRLNYGYAIVRSAIARSLVCTGFHPAFGIHHNNQLNAFNLADDLIEPYRAIVDQTAYYNIGPNERLNKAERKELSGVLFNACLLDGTKVNLISAIELMCESLKRIILDGSSEKLQLPTILAIEKMEGITE